MNERIEGLWWKARIGYNNQQVDPEVLAKFAELIVEECAEMLSKVPGGYDSTLYYNHSRTLKKHFGIEE